MGFSRYARTTIIKLGSQFSTSRTIPLLYKATKNGTVAYTVHIVKQGERLDSLAGRFYNDAKLWWVIAAASGVGWNLQVPPGIKLKIPNLSQVATLVG